METFVPGEKENSKEQSLPTKLTFLIMLFCDDERLDDDLPKQNRNTTTISVIVIIMWTFPNLLLDT